MAEIFPNLEKAIHIQVVKHSIHEQYTTTQFRYC